MNINDANLFTYLGEERLHALIHHFYDLVKNHDDIKDIFPEDLSETKRKQTQFLTQFFGGPDLYTQEHGHPFLRKKHFDFTITPNGAKAWLQCMEQALEKIDITDEAKEFILFRLSTTANHMVNTF